MSPETVNSFWCSVNYVLDFFAYLFEIDYEYRTVNSHRSTISAYHYATEGIPVGKHP